MTEHAENDARLRRWLREWWITLRYGSRLTTAGRALRRNLRADMSEYVEVEAPTRPIPPGSSAADGSGSGAS